MENGENSVILCVCKETLIISPLIFVKNSKYKFSSFHMEIISENSAIYGNGAYIIDKVYVLGSKWKNFE